jgi:TPR repeat protein
MPRDKRKNAEAESSSENNTQNKRRNAQTSLLVQNEGSGNVQPEIKQEETILSVDEVLKLASVHLKKGHVKKAFQVVDKANETFKGENAQILSLLSQYYFEGWGVTKDPLLAYSNAEQASQKGSHSGILMKAKCLELGYGCHQDMLQAIDLYQSLIHVTKQGLDRLLPEHLSYS